MWDNKSMVGIMKRRDNIIIILQVILVLITLSCKDKNNEIKNIIINADETIEIKPYIDEKTELYNIFINGLFPNIDSSEEYIIKNKPYKIKKWPYYTLIDENEKCFEGEKWHEAMFLFWGGVIIFGEKITIISRIYDKSKNYVLEIINENGDIIMDGNIVVNNAKIRIIKDKVEIQYYNNDNEMIKELFEIEEL